MGEEGEEVGEKVVGGVGDLEGIRVGREEGVRVG